MVAIKVISVLALAGAVVAAPVAQPVGEALVARDPTPQRPWGGYRAGYSWRYGWGRPQGAGQDQPAPEQTQSQPTETQAQPETVTVTQGQSDNSGSDAPASSPSTPASSGGSSGSDTGYMAIVNEWRGKMGKPAFTQSSKLQANAQDASDSSGGQLKHKLNPGSMGQVMAPGNAGNFESVFVGGWLCEIPSLVGGASVCDSASQGWNHAGQTGHAEILSSTSYSQIGCALGDGIWTCDVA